VIIKGVLSVRAALKYSDDRFRQQEAYIRDKRGFAAITYQPFKLTTIRANYEEGRQDSVKPSGVRHSTTASRLGSIWEPAYTAAWPNPVVLTGTWNHAARPLARSLQRRAAKMRIRLSLRVSELGVGDPTIRVGVHSAKSSGHCGPPLYTNAFAGGISGLWAVTNRNQWNSSLWGIQRSQPYQQAEHAGQVGATVITTRV